MDPQNKLSIYSHVKFVDGAVTPEQLRKTTLPLALISLVLVACVILIVGIVMALIMNHERLNRPVMIVLFLFLLAFVIGLTFAYGAINQYQ